MTASPIGELLAARAYRCRGLRTPNTSSVVSSRQRCWSPSRTRCAETRCRFLDGACRDARWGSPRHAKYWRRWRRWFWSGAHVFSFTDPHNWIIQSCMRAWEFVESKKHAPRTKTSGATDANILRAAGIPTARLGMPRLKSGNESQRSVFSMETSNVAGMKQLTKCLVYAALDTCTRERQEVLQSEKRS